MTDQEQIVWFKVLVGCWSTLIAMPLTAAVTGPITDPDFPEYVTVWAWMFICGKTLLRCGMARHIRRMHSPAAFNETGENHG